MATRCASCLPLNLRIALIDEPSPRSGDSDYRNRRRLAVRQPFVSFQQRGPLRANGLPRRDTSIRSDRWDGVSFDFVLYGRHIRVRPPWKIIPKPTSAPRNQY